MMRHATIQTNTFVKNIVGGGRDDPTFRLRLKCFFKAFLLLNSIEKSHSVIINNSAVVFSCFY